MSQTMRQTNNLLSVSHVHKFYNDYYVLSKLNILSETIIFESNVTVQPISLTTVPYLWSYMKLIYNYL